MARKRKSESLDLYLAYAQRVEFAAETLSNLYSELCEVMEHCDCLETRPAELLDLYQWRHGAGVALEAIRTPAHV